MEIGLVGLGRMGANMARRLLAGGHRVVVNNRSLGPVEALAAEGAVPTRSRAELVALLAPPRVVWIVLPAGEVTERAVGELADLLSPGDVISDAANSYYRDSMRRADKLAKQGIHFVDAGTSGGIWGLTNGYSMSLGGEPAAVAMVQPFVETLAPGAGRGWGHVGPSGAGHFAKMVHNGIEYGMMQAYAEGFALMRSKEEFALDLRQVAELWREGSVIRSWLLDLAVRALDPDPGLGTLAPVVYDSGEGRWTVLEAIDQGVPAPVITAALNARFSSQDETGYAARLVSALRGQFGGHEVPEAATIGCTDTAGLEASGDGSDSLSVA
jgi:6-phosphogluconate dehydrogenase